MPEGFDARVLADLAREAGVLLHIAEDGRRLERLARLLAFHAPDIEILTFPAWDALPYDRLSPSSGTSGRRIDTLVRLERPTRGPRILVTTSGALLRRLPPADSLHRAAFPLAVGEPVDQEALRTWLIRSGYAPAAAAQDFGDALWSDDGVTVVTPGTDGPLTLDMPGGRLEAMRTPAGALEEAALYPVTDVVLDPGGVERFIAGYLAAFGAEAEDDPLCRAVAAGHRYAGVEHWLPLFHPAMTNLFERVPGAMVTLDEEAEAMRDARLDQVRHAFEARRSQLSVSVRANLAVHRPLPPERVFLTTDEWNEALDGRRVVRLVHEPGGDDAGGRPLTVEGEDIPSRVAALQEGGRRVLVAVREPARRRGFLRHLRGEGVTAEIAADWPACAALPPGTVAVAALDLDAGFAAPGVVVATSAEILGEADGRPERRRSRRLVTDLALEAADLARGSLVVHAEHGIGMSDGLEVLDSTGAPHDCLRLLYKEGSKVYEPVENLDRLWPFGAGGDVPLDKLGSAAWAQRRGKVADALKVAAEELVRVQAERQLARVEPVRPGRAAYRRFVDRFPYDETPGQRDAIAAVLEDLASGRLMDRLVCADVGFGKTEIALRAAFAVATAGRQVAVVAPTTPLCRQHVEDFRARFAGFDARVAELSRGVSAAEARAVKAGLASGEVRIVIGTHALLGNGIAFADLGLLVVDEEQRLGVKQKERLKALSRSTHVLTLTATPIPRTLQLSLAGLRDLSVVATPPVQRRPVRTQAIAFDPATVAAALRAERARGGQCFYVCPHVEDLAEVRARLEAMVPEFRVIEAHGKMPPDAMDDAMTAFSDGDGDLLLATNIIENGLNIPNANTIIVHRADRFGLAQLHQLRGRVGRGAIRGHCWLTTEPDQEPAEAARQRLNVLVNLDKPGAGFELAAQDLGLRGAGDLLGEAQSGNLRAVGVELFQEMLRQAVEAARAGRPLPPPLMPRVTLGEAVSIPEEYIRDPNLRLAVYRRFASLEEAEERDGFAADLTDRFGPLPESAEAVVDLGALKCLCRDTGVEALDIGPNGALLAFAEERRPEDAVLDRVEARWPALKRRPDGRLVLPTEGREPPAFRTAVRRLLRDLLRAGRAVQGAR